MTFDLDLAAAELVHQTTKAQGFPEQIIDRTTLTAIAKIVRDAQGRASKNDDRATIEACSPVPPSITAGAPPREAPRPAPHSPAPEVQAS